MDNGYKNLEQLKRECLIDSVNRITLTLGQPMRYRLYKKHGTSIIDSHISPSNWVKTDIRKNPFFLRLNTLQRVLE